MQRATGIALRVFFVVYAALAVAPVGPEVAGPSGTLFLAGALAGTLASAVLAARVDPVDWFTSLPVVLVGTVPPLAWLGAAVLALFGPSSRPASALFPRLVGALAVVPWLLATMLAYHVRSRRRVAGASVEASFSARPAPAVRRQLRVAVGTLVALVVGGSAVALLFAGDDVSPWGFVWLPLLVPAWLVALRPTSRDVAVTDRGLAVQGTLHAWDTFVAYERGDDELTLHRDAWYRSEFSFDPDDIEDADAVVAALSDHLPAR